LHSLEVVYNDLKLENILINNDGYPCLTDFGLIAPENSYYYEEPVGTVLYFSP
jgi:serine/threonine protein kinase